MLEFELGKMESGGGRDLELNQRGVISADMPQNSTFVYRLQLQSSKIGLPKCRGDRILYPGLLTMKDEATSSCSPKKARKKAGTQLGS